MIEQELLNSQEEVHEVMQALEELAVSYDSKDREIEAAQSEKKLFLEEVEKLQVLYSVCVLLEGRAGWGRQVLFLHAKCFLKLFS